jgi:hypothetical protein
MDDNQVWNEFYAALHSDITEENEFYNQKPLLAHYTSLAVLEKVLTHSEVWLSNPLFMNDIEEVRFGIIEGGHALRHHVGLLEALGNQARRSAFTNALDIAIDYFEREHLFDTYVFCLSEHQPDNQDGLLSMWRGYGGNGRGAAIVFDTAKLVPLENTPLILAKVHYASSAERRAWFDATATRFIPVLSKAALPDDKIYLAAHALFERLKLFALFTKHHGFKEEREWRLAYLSERDTEKLLSPMFHYLNDARGVEPKLRLKIAPLNGVTDDQLSLERVVDRILLGPSTSSPLAKRSVERMLEIIGKPQMKERVLASSIPFRAL